jgi:NADH-ubiquinone oxidoreductase chain 5
MPTPVSALIHAATMVTAGVFLLIRSSYILEYSEVALTLIIIVGSLTALFAATVGLVQNDIKKVIAYSTCSQLGYMVFSCGVSNYSASLFHLMNHAFFKALLFLSAGAVIHALADEQDMRKMGGLIKTLPFTYSLMFIGSLSLAGFPFLTGFYSKDAILELTFAHYSISGSFAYWLGTVSALFTSFYSFRLLFQTFINNPHSSQTNLKYAGESSLVMSLPLFILAIGSIFVGYIGKDAFIGPGSAFFNHSIYVLPNHVTLINAEFLSPLIKFIPVIASIFGALLSVFIYSKSRNINNRSVYIFLSNKWHFDYIYNNYIVKPIFLWGHNVSYKVLDKGLLEALGPLGLSSGIRYLSTIMSKLQSGQVYNYAFTIILFTTFYLHSLTIHLNIEYLIIIPILIFLLS